MVWNGLKAGLTGREADALTRDYISGKKDMVNTLDTLLVNGYRVLESMKQNRKKRNQGFSVPFSIQYLKPGMAVQ